MNKYETVFISDPDLQDQTRKDLFDKVRNIIASEEGLLVDFDEWGSKKLAYEIYKKNRGYYVCLTYGGDGEVVKELERNFRLTDHILKFMTIVLDKDVEPQALEEMAKAASEARAAQPVEATEEQASEEEEKTDAPAEDAAEETAEEGGDTAEEAEAAAKEETE
ncbi:MAG: 30S ribosomal protein S6 [Desulfobacteraceae bacterium]|nr:MAG: 30S ribosomal protein S6 [Desulfobacteraceae bacterium]